MQPGGGAGGDRAKDRDHRRVRLHRLLLHLRLHLAGGNPQGHLAQRGGIVGGFVHLRLLPLARRPRMVPRQRLHQLGGQEGGVPHHPDRLVPLSPVRDREVPGGLRGQARRDDPRAARGHDDHRPAGQGQALAGPVPDDGHAQHDGRQEDQDPPQGHAQADRDVLGGDEWRRGRRESDGGELQGLGLLGAGERRPGQGGRNALLRPGVAAG
mmetsp:Transcript_34334/g.77603  ORF Transcript_34334/g.77603 Transcript_34334/m.77603 type:complete len:211 (+) Transcript_34334:382-1014(+)